VEGGNEVGVTTGMSWTPAGGELLFIEVTLMHGTGRLQITGRLGDVMKESVQAAMSFVRSNANELGIYSKAFISNDVHIHFPEGAISKDGPSAGVAIATSLVSAFTKIPVRKPIAMTGEITLHGKVLQIGGLKEKLLAAKRGLIEHALIPYDNQNDLTEIPNEIKKGLKISVFKHATDMLNIALEHIPERVVDPGSDDDPKSGVNEDIIQPATGVNDVTPSVYTLTR